MISRCKRKLKACANRWRDASIRSTSMSSTRTSSATSNVPSNDYRFNISPYRTWKRLFYWTFDPRVVGFRTAANLWSTRHFVGGTCGQSGRGRYVRDTIAGGSGALGAAPPATACRQWRQCRSFWFDWSGHFDRRCRLILQPPRGSRCHRLTGQFLFCLVLVASKVRTVSVSVLLCIEVSSQFNVILLTQIWQQDKTTINVHVSLSWRFLFRGLWW